MARFRVVEQGDPYPSWGVGSPEITPDPFVTDTDDLATALENLTAAIAAGSKVKFRARKAA